MRASDNSLSRASVRSDYEDNQSNDDAENAKEDVDAVLRSGGVRIGFGRHGTGSCGGARVIKK